MEWIVDSFGGFVHKVLVIVPANFGELWTSFDCSIIEFFRRSRTEKPLWTLFLIAPVEPTLSRFLRRINRWLVLSELGFCALHLIALVFSHDGTPVQPVSVTRVLIWSFNRRVHFVLHRFNRRLLFAWTISARRLNWRCALCARRFNRCSRVVLQFLWTTAPVITFSAAGSVSPVWPMYSLCSSSDQPVLYTLLVLALVLRWLLSHHFFLVPKAVLCWFSFSIATPRCA